MDDYLIDSASEDEDDEEMKEYEAEASEGLKSGELVVPNGDGTYRCPFCVSKKKQDYKYHELLAHAQGVGKGKRGIVLGGQHRALASFLETELSAEAAPAAVRSVRLQQAAPSKEKVENMIVHPWVGLLYNIGTFQTGGKIAGPGQGELKEKFASFSPEQVKCFWNSQGFLGCAAVVFKRGMDGYDDARSFEKSFLDRGCGKNNWERNNSCGLGDALYGWLAGEEDFKQDSVVGKHLRDHFNLKTMNQIEEEKTRAHEQQYYRLAETIQEQQLKIQKSDVKMWGLQNLVEKAENSRRKCEQEKLMLEEKHKQELKALRSESERIQNQHQQETLKRHRKLEDEMTALDKQCKQLSMKESGSEAQRATLEEERLEYEKQLNLRAQAQDIQKKFSSEQLSLVEKHGAETRNLENDLQQRKMLLAKKQQYELQQQYLEEKIKLEEVYGQVDPALHQEIEKLKSDLADQVENLDAAHDQLNVMTKMQTATTTEINRARDVAIKALGKFGSEKSVGIRRVGEIDDAPWKEAAKKAYKNAAGGWECRMREVLSEYEALLANHEWFPYTTIKLGEKDCKRVVNSDDEKLVRLRQELGEDVYQSVATALLEIDEYNSSGRYPIPMPWNYIENRLAPLAEAFQQLFTVTTANEAKVKKMTATCMAATAEIKTLKDLVETLGGSAESAGKGRGRGKRKKVG